jgi:hypothetical protein
MKENSDFHAKALLDSVNLKKVVDIFKKMDLNKMTGVVTITLYVNQGGIRDAKKSITLEEKSLRM